MLYVSRLEPENNAAMVIEAFRKVETAHKLAIVGDTPYAAKYKEHLLSLAAGDDRIRFLGGVYGPDKKALEQAAAAYIHATEVGGTHPASIEAMGAGNCCLVYARPRIREVAADAGLYYSDADGLVNLLKARVVRRSPGKGLSRTSRERVREHYDWETVTDSYERLFDEIVRQ